MPRPDLVWATMHSNLSGIPTQSTVVCVFPASRRNIILRFWGYADVDHFSKNEPQYKNHFAFTIPLVGTLTSRTSKKFIDLCSMDLAGELPFQVLWLFVLFMA